MSLVFIYWYWIYHANTWGMNVNWGVSVRPSGAGLGYVRFQNYIFVLDIFCQHLGNKSQLNIYVGIGYIMSLGGLKGFCAPFGRRVGVCTFLELNICNGYMLPTFQEHICL